MLRDREFPHRGRIFFHWLQDATEAAFRKKLFDEGFSVYLQQFCLWSFVCERLQCFGQPFQEFAGSIEFPLFSTLGCVGVDLATQS